MFVLKQKNNTITTTDCTSNEVIYGTRECNTVTFLSSDQQGDYSEMTGELIINTDGSILGAHGISVIAWANRAARVKRTGGIKGNRQTGITPVDSLRMAYVTRMANSLPNRIRNTWRTRITAVDSLRLSY
jgi:hypothetical protein